MSDVPSYVNSSMYPLYTTASEKEDLFCIGQYCGRVVGLYSIYEVLFIASTENPMEIRSISLRGSPVALFYSSLSEP